MLVPHPVLFVIPVRLVSQELNNVHFVQKERLVNFLAQPNAPTVARVALVALATMSASSVL